MMGGALRILDRQLRVDLLFTDVVLPGSMTRAQVAAQAKAIRPSLKVCSPPNMPATQSSFTAASIKASVDGQALQFQ
jgi:hypothetical protein